MRPLVQESAPRLVQVLVPPLDLRKEKGLDPQSEMMLWDLGHPLGQRGAPQMNSFRIPYP